MAVRLSVCPYRLLFKRPFGTTHGLRTGTDALFVRAEEEGLQGHGEITLPPYVKETIPEALESLRTISSSGLNATALFERMQNDPGILRAQPGCRAGLHTALLDLAARRAERSARAFLGAEGMARPTTLMTIGICPIGEVESRLSELEKSGALKVKVGDAEARSRIGRIIALDNRPLFLDGNQGVRSIDEAVALVDRIGPERCIGFEQPFARDQDAWNKELADRSGIPVYGDESLQDPEELAARGAHFGGVNVKLMKCGGLDRALPMIHEAWAAGMKVMLGSMSESSLGCTAMASLACLAGIVDLDGPWLIQNDPWSGIAMAGGELVLADGPGLGVELIAPLGFEILQY